MIKHESIFSVHTIAEDYSKKEGVAITYVCTSALGSEARAIDIFYRDSPHPRFGNRYFGLFLSNDSTPMITKADLIEDAEFAMIEDENGDLHYSAHRHDYKVINGKMIDGGRAYIRTNTDVRFFKVKDGEFLESKVCSQSKKDVEGS